MSNPISGKFIPVINQQSHSECPDLPSTVLGPATGYCPPVASLASQSGSHSSSRTLLFEKWTVVHLLQSQIWFSFPPYLPHPAAPMLGAPPCFRYLLLLVIFTMETLLGKTRRSANKGTVPYQTDFTLENRIMGEVKRWGKPGLKF